MQIILRLLPDRTLNIKRYVGRLLRRMLSPFTISSQYDVRVCTCVHLCVYLHYFEPPNSTGGFLAYGMRQSRAYLLSG